MPPEEDDLVRLPGLVAALLTDLNLAFRQANAQTLKSLPFQPSAVFRLGGAHIEMEGRAARVESGGILFFPGDQTQKGSAFKIAMPIQVQNPPEEHPWELAGGLLVVDDEARVAIYKAAITAVGHVGMNTMGDAPIWRVAPAEYLVLVPGDVPRAAHVKRGSSGWTGESLTTLDALWPVLGRLVEALAKRYASVLGKVT